MTLIGSCCYVNNNKEALIASYLCEDDEGVLIGCCCYGYYKETPNESSW